MEDVGGVADGGAHGAFVAHVAQADLDRRAEGAAQPAQVSLDARSRQVVENPHAAAAFHQSRREVCADEAGTAGDDGGAARARPAGANLPPHTVKPRSLSSAFASATRSAACCPLNHPASSINPASSVIWGSYPSTVRAR